jgi:hypothetical protein
MELVSEPVKSNGHFRKFLHSACSSHRITQVRTIQMSSEGTHKLPPLAHEHLVPRFNVGALHLKAMNFLGNVHIQHLGPEKTYRRGFCRLLYSS